MKYIIAVDIGTTSAKIIAYDITGKILEKLNANYKILSPKDGFYEQNPEEIFDSFILNLKELIAKYGKENLAAVSFSSAMHSIIAIDKKGKVLTNSILWSDSRSKSYVKEFKDTKEAHEIFLKTGTPVHPMSPLFKIMWIKNNLNEVFNKTYKFISIKEYIFFKLFNEYYIDYSIASATGIFNIYEKNWNKNSLEYLGIDERYFSKPVDVTYKVFGMKSEYLEYLNMESTTPFIIGASDGCLANLGVNDMEDGTAVMTLGTSGAIRVSSRNAAVDSKERIFTYILDNDYYILGGAVNNVGIIIEWLKEKFDKDLTYEDLFEDFFKTEDEESNLVFLPYLLGERAPIWNAHTRGVFFGINLAHEKRHFIRAVLEGIIYSLYDVFNTLEEIKDIKKIYVNGGLSKSRIFIQTIADIFGRNILVAENYESSCFGAFIIGLKAIGEIESIEEYKTTEFIIESFKPNEKNNLRYKKNFLIYKKLYENLKEMF